MEAMNTTLKVSYERDDVQALFLMRVAHGVADALTRAGDVANSLPDEESQVLTVAYHSLNRAEAERTRDAIVGALTPLVKRVIGTRLDREVKP